MKIIVSGSHLEQFPEMRAYTEKKASKLSKYNSQIEEIRIRLISERSHRNESHNSTCEIAVDLPGKNLEIVENDDSMDKAIDKAIERMQRLLVKAKEKRISKWHKFGIIEKIRGRF